MKTLETYGADNEKVDNNFLDEEKAELDVLESELFRDDFYENLDNLPDISGIEMSDKVKEILEKVLGKALESTNILFGIDQSSLEGKNLEDHFTGVMIDHPELWGMINFDLRLGGVISQNYEEVNPSDKIKLLAFMSALEDNLIFENTHIKEDGSFDIQKMKERYKFQLKGINHKISSIFKISQFKNLGQVEKTLKKEFGLSPEEIKEFLSYLKNLETALKASKPAEGKAGYLAAFLLGMIMSGMGMYIYEDLTTNESHMQIIPGEIDLTGISLLAKLVTAEGGFEGSDFGFIEQFEEEESDWEITKKAKRAANFVQSKKIVMQLTGKVGAEFDISKESGASFIYHPKDKIIRISLNEPEFIIRESNPDVIYSNNAVFEVDKFKNLEFDMLKNIEKKAVEDEKITGPIAEIAKENLANIIYDIYKPIIESELIPEEYRNLKGVEITINGKKVVNSETKLKN